MTNKKKSPKAFVVTVMTKDGRDLEHPVVKVIKPTHDEFGDPVAKHNPDKWFLPAEQSNYLADALKGVSYGTFVTDDPDVMETVMEHGLKLGKTRWTVFFPFWRDQEGHAFMVPTESGINNLRSVGIRTFMKSPGDFMKTAKFVNRLFIPSPAGLEVVWGDLVSDVDADGIALFKLDVDVDDRLRIYNGAIISRVQYRKVKMVSEEKKIPFAKLPKLTDEDKVISVKFKELGDMTPDQKALGDGSFVFGERYSLLTGLSDNPLMGDAYRWTLGSPVKGSGKGHAIYKEDLQVDLVIYGPKPYVLTDRFFFANLGPLKASNRPKTDPQAFANFGFHRPGLAFDWARKFMQQVWEFSKDDANFRQLLLRHSIDQTDLDQDSETWILPVAIRYGFETLSYPGLYRRGENYLIGDRSPVFQCDGRARIPLEGVAMYAYVAMDPAAVDSEGDIHPELSPIPAGYVVCPDLKPGSEIVMYRQPSENQNAHVFAKVWHSAEYDKYKGRGLVLLGQGASVVMLRLGGADMDDSFMIVYNPICVEAFHDLDKHPYPETEKVSSDPDVVAEEDLYVPQGIEKQFLNFTDQLYEEIQESSTRSVQYNNRHAAWQIEMAKGGGTGLGTAVNYVTLDAILSHPDHKAAMIADLLSRGLKEQAEWLEYYEDYQAKKIGTNLEIVIDGNVKDPTLLKKLAKELAAIKPWHDACQVYPECMAGKEYIDPETGELKRKGGKIPASKVKKGDYVLAKSLMCQTLADIRAVREELIDAFNVRQWMLVRPGDEVLRDAYPYDDDLATLVNGKWAPDPDNPGRKKRIDDGIDIRHDLWADAWIAEFAQEDKDHNRKDPETGLTPYDVICQGVEDVLFPYTEEEREKIAVELYFKIYRSFAIEPKYDDRTGKMRGFSDGLLWSPVFAMHFINAVRKAGNITGVYLSGMYKPAVLDPKWRRRLLVEHANNDVEVFIDEDALVYIKGEEGEFTQQVGHIDGKSWTGHFRMHAGMVQFREAEDICRAMHELRPPDRVLEAVIKQMGKKPIEGKNLKEQAEEAMDSRVKEVLDKAEKKSKRSKK